MLTTDRYDTIKTQHAMSSAAQSSTYRHRRRRYHGLTQCLMYGRPARKLLEPVRQDPILYDWKKGTNL